MTSPVSHRRRVGALVSLALLAGLGGVTSAVFQDAEVVEGNAFTAGVLDLSTGDATEVLTAEGMVPGDQVAEVVTLSNAGDVPLEYSISVARAEGAGELAKVLEVSAHLADEPSLATTENRILHAVGLPAPDTVVTTPKKRQLAPGEQQKVVLAAVMQTGAGTEWSDVTTQLEFTIDANPEARAPDESETGDLRVVDYSGGATGLALLSDGSVWLWMGGLPAEKIADDSWAGDEIVGVAMGASAGYALGASGALYGLGDQQLLGNGPQQPGNDLAMRPAGTAVSASYSEVFSGRASTIAKTDDGQLLAWGGNPGGQLGIGSDGPIGIGPDGADRVAHSPLPVAPSGALEGVVIEDVDIETYTTVARSADGRVFGWGEHNGHQLGVAPEGILAEPVEVLESLDVPTVQIAGSTNGTLALGADGKLRFVGDGRYGQVGNGVPADHSEPVYYSTPELVDLSPMHGDPVVSIAGANRASFAVTESGDLYGWGEASSIGTAQDTAVPQRLNAEGEKFVSVEGGLWWATALTDDGQLWLLGGEGRTPITFATAG